MESLEKALKKCKKLPKKLRRKVEEELERVRAMDDDVKVQLYVEGFLIYSLGDSPLVMATIHDGSYVPKDIDLVQSKKDRGKEEDLFSGELYMPIFLGNGGTWVTTHVSRYVADLNRRPWQAILKYEAPEDGINLRASDNPQEAIKKVNEYYNKFYKAFSRCLRPGQFLFSGHTMCDRDNRGEIELEYWNPKDAEPLKELLEKEGFNDITVNEPFSFEQAQSQLNFFAQRYVGRDRHMAFETNKRIYMDEHSQEKSEVFDTTQKGIDSAVSRYLRKILSTDDKGITSLSFF